MQKRLILIVAMAALVRVAQAKDEPHLTVEVLKAETVHWTVGTTKTDCDLDDSSASCTSTSQRVVPTERIPIVYQVNLLVRMPDGSTVAVQCHRTTSVKSMMTPCQQPEPGTYAAKINDHDIRLLIPVAGKPQYNKDGSQKPVKTTVQEVRFSFK